jgi:glycosyltransferase involved in cell wall biosynthesis
MTLRTSSPPQVSVVIATFNRCNALRCAIESVRQQSFDDWEIVVVGDRCTDDTDIVVASFDDPRIRFINLLRNTGEQAGPTNVGIAESRGALIAFLNHDDVWLPEHLEACREALLAGFADVVFGTAACIVPDSHGKIEWDRLEIGLVGLGERNRWSPGELDVNVAPASSLFARREVIERVGGWRPARECIVEPSQDLLFRIWRQRGRIRPVGLVTLVIAPAGHRAGSYVDGDASEQEWALARAGDPTFSVELAALALETNEFFDQRARRRPSKVVQALALCCARVGIDPRGVLFRARRLRRGEYVDGLRAIRGLPALARPRGAAAAVRYEMVRRSCRIDPGTTVSFAAGAGGARYLASGWSRPAAQGVWSDGACAQLLFDFGSRPHQDLTLELGLTPFLPPGTAVRRVAVTVGDGAPAPIELDGPTTLTLPVPASSFRASFLTVDFQFDDPASPLSAGLSEDARELSIMLVSARLAPVD